MEARILIIEDEAAMCEHIRRAIQDGIPDAQVHTAFSWEEFHRLLDAHVFDAVVSGLYYYGDIEGRGYNTVLENISASTHGIPTIFLGRWADPRHVFEAAKGGAYDFMLLDRNFEPKQLINSVRSAVELGRIPQVFISYSSDDREFAKTLATAIQDHGFQVWYDDWEILVGESIIQKIESGITASSYLVVVLSPASVTSRWVREELDSAMTSQITDRRLRMLPALKNDCVIPPFLRSKKYADFRSGFDEGLLQIINAIKADRENAK